MAGRSTAPAEGGSGWEHFSHDADIGIRGFGPSIVGSMAMRDPSVR